MFKFSLGYPDEATEQRMIMTQLKHHPLEEIEPVADAEQVYRMQQLVREVHIDEAVVSYLVAVTRATREQPSVFLGASPRATLALVQASKAFAYLQGRSYVIPDDIKFLAPYVLGHRMILKSEALMDGATPAAVLDKVFQSVRVPIRLEK
jgi:MoxR-like ATPase